MEGVMWHQRLRFLCSAIGVLVIASMLGGCVWVSNDRYYTASGEDNTWSCSHYIGTETCRFKSGNVTVSINLTDKSNHSTWAGIWPIPFIPVWFATDPKVQSANPTIGITWDVRGTQSVTWDIRATTLALDTGQTLAPIKVTRTVLDGGEPTTSKTPDPAVPTGYSYGSITYGLKTLPDKFTLKLSDAELTDGKIEFPVLRLKLESGYHYNESSL